MNGTRARVVAFALTGMLVGSAAATASPAASTLKVPAIWNPHVMIVDLDKLPHAYDCDALWYRFRFVLLGIGARADTLNIKPYNCSTRSPSVEIHFQLPQALQSSQAKWADFQASSTQVQLDSGKPGPFEPSDCELMRQIRQELLGNLPVKVTAFQANCTAPQGASSAFHLQVQTLKAGGSPVSQVASDHN